MKNKNKKGFYHTGEDSFCHPEIKYFRRGIDVPLNFAWGPFRTRALAQKDFEKMVASSISNLQELYDNVIKLRGKK